MPFQLRKLDTVIDAHHLKWRSRCDGIDGNLIRYRHRYDVGEVIFALGIAVIQTRCPSLQQSARDRQHAGIDLIDGALLFTGILFFDNTLHRPIIIPYDPSITRRLIEFGGE
jgi:hypothetical protein